MGTGARLLYCNLADTNQRGRATFFFASEIFAPSIGSLEVQQLGGRPYGERERTILSDGKRLFVRLLPIRVLAMQIAAASRGPRARDFPARVEILGQSEIRK